MSDETLALSTITPVLPAQGDYDAICAALMRTERGRWFLQEYAKRNRHADTEVLLVAIQRLDAVVRADKGQQAEQGFRSDLLEMAKAITRARAEVAEIKPERSPRSDAICSGCTASPAANGSRVEDVFATAERIRDVTWAMRGHGFDPTVCGQLEELAASILSASSLRDPTDQRIRKLSEVLQYLELRIDTLLDGAARPTLDEEKEEDRDAADGTVASRACNGVQPDDATLGSQAPAIDQRRLQGNDDDVAPGPESPAAAAVAPLASAAEEAAELAVAAELAQAPEGEAAFSIAPPDDSGAIPADTSAAVPPESENGSVLQQAPEADPAAAMEPGETLHTLLPAVELPEASRMLFKPVAGQAFPLISHESPTSLFPGGIETGAAVWDFGVPAAAETPSTVAPVQAESGHIDITSAEQLAGESIQGEGTEIDLAQGGLAQAELRYAEPALAELAHAELAQAEPAQIDQAQLEPAEEAAAQIEASHPEASPPTATQLEPVDGAVGAASGEAQAFNLTLLEVGSEPAPPIEEPHLLMPATKPAAADADAHLAPPVEAVARSASVVSAPTGRLARASRSPDDPLAALEAMSDEERIALFT